MKLVIFASVLAVGASAKSCNKTEDCKEKVKEDRIITKEDLINNQFLLLQKGKKNYFIIKVI